MRYALQYLVALTMVCGVTKLTTGGEVGQAGAGLQKEKSVVLEDAAASAERIKWWREARFGMFIHWGLYAIPAKGEWVQWNDQIPNEEYAKLADEFKGEKFNAAEWAQVAKDAGMKYMVLTARHHDGFALFDTKAGDFSSVKKAAGRDFVAEYVKAVREAGLGVGLYYSPLDWRFPGYISPEVHLSSAEAMREQYHVQMEELCSNYGKLDVIWFDGGEQDWLSFGGGFKGAQWAKRPRDQSYKGRFSWQHAKVYQMLRAKQPSAVINGRADMPEDFHPREGDGALGGFDDQKPWELCTTIAGAWGYQAGKKPKSTQQVVQQLAKVVGRDGNLLMNVGPKADGTIDQDQVAVLKGVGEWLKFHGEAVYGTRGGPWLPTDEVAYTRKGKAVYVFLLTDGDRVVIPDLEGRKLLRVQALGSGKSLGVGRAESGAMVTLTANTRDQVLTVLKAEFDGDVMGVAVKK